MVTKAELVSIARKQKLPLGMIEKDFVLTLVLREIYNSRFKNTLVFKDFEKLAEKRLTAMNDNMDIGKVFKDLDIVKSLWKVDQEQLIPELPDFDGVMNDLKSKLEL